MFLWERAAQYSQSAGFFCTRYLATLQLLSKISSAFTLPICLKETYSYFENMLVRLVIMKLVYYSASIKKIKLQLGVQLWIFSFNNKIHFENDQQNIFSRSTYLFESQNFKKCIGLSE